MIRIGYDSKFIWILMLFISFISFSSSIQGAVNLKALYYFTKGCEKGRSNYSSTYLKPTVPSRTYLFKSVCNEQTGRSCSYK